MTPTGFGLATLVTVTLAVLTYWNLSARAHWRRMDALEVRVHVNGIRGKSTVTRLVAGVLREGGFRTVAKTTGSAARVIQPTGVEAPIARRGAATILEQVDIVRQHVGPGVEALVLECMAVRPAYQEYAQDHIVRADITIITNVREDHQEEMGETLEEIADSMALTTPVGGVLITAEDRGHLRDRLAERARERGSEFRYADPASVDKSDMRGFGYIQFAENVAIGLEVARIVGIPREAAIRGMWKSTPDVGVVRLEWYPLGESRVLWIPLFAANDRESVVRTFEALQPQFPDGAPVIGILNNRQDRGRRAELFADMVPNDLEPFLDHVFTFGAFEDTVIPRMVAGGYPADRIHRLGDSVSPSLEDVLAQLSQIAQGREVVLVGMVNIHTHQAELLLDHFKSLHPDGPIDEVAMSATLAHAPSGIQRLASDRSRRTRRGGAAVAATAGPGRRREGMTRG